MQTLPVILAVILAAAAIIAVLFWRLKPQSTTNLEVVENRVRAESEKVQALQAKAEGHEKEVRDALMASSSAKAASEGAEARAIAAEMHRERAQADLASLQKKHNEVEPQVATAKAEREAAETAKADLVTRLADLTTRHAALQTDYSQMLGRATNAEAEAAGAKAEAEAVRERAEAADARATEVTVKHDTIHADLSRVKASLAEASAQRDAVAMAKADMETSYSALIAKHDLLIAEHKTAVANAASAKEQAENTHTRNGEILRAYEIVKEELDAVKRELIVAAEKQQSTEDTTRHFENISQAVLKEVVEEAKRNVGELAGAFQKFSGDELNKHAEKVATTLQPLQTKLDAYDEVIEKFQKEALGNYLGIREQMISLQEAERSLHEQAKALTTALSSTPKHRGTYGELALERLMEHAGLQEGPHYEKQARRNTEDGLKIPDIIVKMPGNQKVVVDAKAVMNAYVAAQETQDTLQREALLKQHSDNVRSRVTDLSAKNYFKLEADTVELVVLFLPAENLYVAAVENDHTLADFAMSRNVIICGPSLLLMLLKSANQLWRRASIEEEALKIKHCGDDIYNAACLFIERYARLGTKISQLEDAFNDAAGTLNGNLIPKSRNMGKFAAVASSKEIEDAVTLKEGVRQFSSPEAKKVLAVTTKLPELIVGDETAEMTFSTGDA